VFIVFCSLQAMTIDAEARVVAAESEKKALLIRASAEAQVLGDTGLSNLYSSITDISRCVVHACLDNI
jgi:hypothetical protein